MIPFFQFALGISHYVEFYVIFRVTEAEIELLIIETELLNKIDLRIDLSLVCPLAAFPSSLSLLDLNSRPPS